MTRRLRFGMIGGGRGAFIGGVHRIAAQLDGEAELVAGAFSSDPQRAHETGADLYLDAARVYGSYEEMASKESQLPDEQRLDFVTIVTPNHEHCAPAKLFLEAGFNVVCEKPLAHSLTEAVELQRVVEKSRKVFVLTHNYIGNPMVKEARSLVRAGHLGAVRKVIVEYPQGWLATRVETAGQKQAEWRTDPERSGAAGCLGDIGTHAANLVAYVTGLQVSELCAELTTFLPGRRLDDDAAVLLRFRGGAKGVLHSSQICVGEENGLNLRVYGEQAGLEWHQEHPNELIVKYQDRPAETRRRGNQYLSVEASASTRIPAGHPEGYLEAFANVYREAYRAIRAEVSGHVEPPDLDFATIEDGVDGMRFIDAAVRSSASGARWTALSE